jgi:hypothetical protein
LKAKLRFGAKKKCIGLIKREYFHFCFLLLLRGSEKVRKVNSNMVGEAGNRNFGSHCGIKC